MNPACRWSQLKERKKERKKKSPFEIEKKKKKSFGRTVDISLNALKGTSQPKGIYLFLFIRREKSAGILCPYKDRERCIHTPSFSDGYNTARSSHSKQPTEPVGHGDDDDDEEEKERQRAQRERESFSLPSSTKTLD